MMVSIEDLHNLRHTLGATWRGRKQRNWGYRNYYCTGGEKERTESMQRLACVGLVKENKNIPGNWHATEEAGILLGFTNTQLKRTRWV